MSRLAGDPTTGRRAGRGAGNRAGGRSGAGEAEWPESVRVVALQPSLWSGERPEATPPPERPAAVVRLGPDALVPGGVAEIALSREIGQSFYLMGLLALVLFAFVGFGLLMVRMLA